MKRVLSSAGLIVALASSAEGAHRSDLREMRQEERSMTFEVGATGSQLAIDNLFGSIRVRGGSTDAIEVTLVKSVFARDPEALREAIDEVELKVTHRGQLVDLYVDGPFRAPHRQQRWRRLPDLHYRVVYDFEALVPPSTSLTLKTVDGGDLTVARVAGAFDIANVNGGVHMERVAGSGSVSTVNGPVRVSFTRNPELGSRFETVNGDVEIDFQPGLSADLSMQSTFGHLWADFDVRPLPSPPPTETTRDGLRVIHVSGAARVRTGDGGPTLEFETMNGDVLLRSRSSPSS